MKIISIRALGFVASAALLMGVYGCGDVLTYSQDSKREGIRQYNDGRYAEATASFRNALRQNPADPEADYWLGMSYEASADSHEAVNAYKTALAQMPKPGMAHYSQEFHDQVFDRIAHVIANSDPTNTEADIIIKDATDRKSSELFCLAGRIFRYRGDADTALDEYHTAIRLDPDNFPAQKELGLYLEQLTQNQEAATVLRDAYRLNPDDKDVNDALRQIGMVPGPGLLAQDQLAKPLLPNGPIPDLGAQPASSHVTTVTPGQAPTLDQPRD